MTKAIKKGDKRREIRKIELKAIQSIVEISQAKAAVYGDWAFGSRKWKKLFIDLLDSCRKNEGILKNILFADIRSKTIRTMGQKGYPFEQINKVFFFVRMLMVIDWICDDNLRRAKEGMNKKDRRLLIRANILKVVTLDENEKRELFKKQRGPAIDFTLDSLKKEEKKTLDHIAGVRGEREGMVMDNIYNFSVPLTLCFLKHKLKHYISAINASLNGEMLSKVMAKKQQEMKTRNDARIIVNRLCMKHGFTVDQVSRAFNPFDDRKIIFLLPKRY